MTAPSAVDVMRAGYAGRIGGRAVDLHTIGNAGGMVARLTNHGARLVQLTAADRHGRFDDVVLGYDGIDRLLTGHVSAGATIGRYAGRIRDARFRLDGRLHRLTANDGAHHLHGGAAGSRFKIFDTDRSDGRSVRFSCRFEDGEEGYPGNCRLAVTYALTDDDALEISYEATTDAPTVLNVTNHAFWNLAGHGRGDILGHELWIGADRYAPTDRELLPTGELLAVHGTPFDFTRPAPIGHRLHGGVDRPGRDRACGVNFVLGEAAGRLRHAARVHDPGSGRTMDVHTTEPALLYFPGTGFDGASPRDLGKQGVLYPRHAGFALETQHLPDSPNIAAFPPTVLRPGERFRSVTVHRFAAMRRAAITPPERTP